MSDQDIHQNKYSELRNICKHHIDAYNTLYQLKTEKEEDLNSIYKMIKTELIESMKFLPQKLMKDILDIIPYNNRYTKSYLFLVKLISDEYHIKEVKNIPTISNFLFYKEYGIKLDKSDEFEEINSENLDIYTTNTIYRAIMNNDKERFIFFIESEGFYEDQTLKSKLYPFTGKDGYSLLELCCYHGAVDCFKLLRTKFHSKITYQCLLLSFLGRNPEIMNECLKHQKPEEACMEYAIISHNIDFVTFLMNEYKININLDYCEWYNNLESFLICFDQTNDVDKCYMNSTMFNIPSICEYFLLYGANINEKDNNGNTTLHYAAQKNSKEIFEFLISHGANINNKTNNGNTALHIAADYKNIEIAELIISHGANVNEKNNNAKTALHYAARKNSKETTKLLISYGANINEKANNGKTALHYAACHNSAETAELLISHGADINEKDNNGDTAFHIAAQNNSKETAKFLISHGANINIKNKDGDAALHIAAIRNNEKNCHASYFI
ncbi:ankyrin repeat protein, putative [Trichomonas vaginalis G3]|uniref:Ankyrin repeat protein, putative n=1 Tax=Trichomonas vaginalis (strain ATCC PRA-98 / G3) TaxID=412133 RepID=A2FRH8_TRIV3|nr:ankyrin repeat and SOCS box-containing protein 4 family [Trichomonas vaginalis G3]EAX92480.1 ankyrin repeat protein, putative [Trichomonas vaginalis G3]KAI5504663.1 ankyrin repeat and SOCS box-containing protein 4 family [Trichomonas vaginalis G3]|eukprot:XP_001305410.1 ankyrin repeat protein [Trichomonas vaginalis G3]